MLYKFLIITLFLDLTLLYAKETLLENCLKDPKTYQNKELIEILSLSNGNFLEAKIIDMEKCNEFTIRKNSEKWLNTSLNDKSNDKYLCGNNKAKVLACLELCNLALSGIDYNTCRAVYNTCCENGTDGGYGCSKSKF